MARDALIEIGYRVAVVHSAEEAIRVFDAAADGGTPFNLVFTDGLMPGGADGLALGLAGQIHQRLPEAPVLLTTGYNDQMSIDGSQAGADEALRRSYK